MAETQEAQLAKLESERQKHVDAIAKLDDQIAPLRAALRESVLAAAKQQAAQYGFTPAELFGVAALPASKPKAKSGKRGPAVAKYRDEHGNTWGGGKGPRPAWVKAIQAAGGNLEKYRVQDAPASASKAAAQRLAAQGGTAPEMAEVPRRRPVA